MSDEKERSYILIEFEDIGSAAFNTKYENVVPGQILIASTFLDFEGKNQLAIQRAAQMQAEQMNKIAVPTPNMPVKP